MNKTKGYLVTSCSISSIIHQRYKHFMFLSFIVHDAIDVVQENFSDSLPTQKTHIKEAKWNKLMDKDETLCQQYLKFSHHLPKNEQKKKFN